MLDFFQTKQHRIIFSIFAGLVIIIMVIMVISGIMTFFGKNKYYKGSSTNSNLIYFSGEGKVYTKPDVAFVDFSVVTQGSRINDVQDTNSKKMNKVVTLLKSSGVEEKDIKTTNYSLYPQYIYEGYRVPQITGYQINQTVSIKIRDLDKIGEILQGVVEVGINQVNSFYFGVENDEELKEQAREMAIKDAKEKAEKLASQIGINLKKVVGFSETTNGYPVPMYDKAEYGMGGGSGSPNVEVGENEIAVNVTLTYEIE